MLECVPVSVKRERSRGCRRTKGIEVGEKERKWLRVLSASYFIFISDGTGEPQCDKRDVVNHRTLDHLLPNRPGPDFESFV